MSIVAVSMVRDELDILPYTIQHLLLEGVDRVLVADNMSIDGTLAWLNTAPSKVQVIRDEEVGYYQARKMTDLAARAAEPDDWVVPFDADELWTGIDKLRDLDANLAYARPFVHVPTLTDNDDNLNPCTRLEHRMRGPEQQSKVAFRWREGANIHMGNHEVDVNGPRKPVLDVLDVRHFQYRSLSQVARKVRQGTKAYEATNMSRVLGTHWRDLAALSDVELAAWWDGYVTQDDLVFDPAPYALSWPMTHTGLWSVQLQEPGSPGVG